MKKCCSQCKQEKDLSEYRRDRSTKSGYTGYCKVCARRMQKSTYMSTYGDKVKVQNKANRQRNADKIKEYKSTHPCVKCGETDVACLEFHHSDPTAKEFTIGNSLQRSWPKLIAEIEKCIVVCSNCHKKHHAGRFEL